LQVGVATPLFDGAGAITDAGTQGRFAGYCAAGFRGCDFVHGLYVRGLMENAASVVLYAFVGTTMAD